MLPDWTKGTWPPTNPIVALADARNWIGVYGDTSVDAEVQVCLNAAVEKVASHVGYRISDTCITDYYSTKSPRFLILSEPGIDVKTIEVKYYAAADDSLTTVANTEYYIDETVQRHKIIFNENFDIDISDKYENGLQVDYKSKLTLIRGQPTVERLKQAVRVALNWFWNNRGQQQDPHLLDKTMSSLLNGAKLNGPIASA